MKHEDLTPEEHEALELLRANAADAPEALANLDESGRARVLGVLSAGTGARESDDSVAATTDGSSSEAADDEPTLEAVSAVQSTGPTTFADRVWQPTVAVAGKRVPLIPSSVGVVVVLVALVLLLRACVGAGSAAWCDDLDTAIDQGWNSDGGANDGGHIGDMGFNAWSHIDEYRSYTDEEMTEFEEALEEAWYAGSRYDGKESARAWEDSLRDAC